MILVQALILFVNFNPITMTKYCFFFLFIIFCKVTEAQNNDIHFAYGGSFAGFGDLQGKFMSVGYHHKIYKFLFAYGSLSQASMSGRAGETYQSDKYLLGADQLHPPILDISSLDKNNELSVQYSSVGSKIRLDPPKSMMNTKSLDMGAQFYLLRGSKLGLYIEGNISLVKLEWIGTPIGQIITVENKAWFNIATGKPDILLITPAQEHFLDWGLGYGIGLNYYLNSFLTIGANGHYNDYAHDAQNIVTWNFRLGVKLGK
jgi:hypothetical protein